MSLALGGGFAAKRGLAVSGFAVLAYIYLARLFVH